MPINLGTSAMSAAYLGATPLSAIYLGSTLIWTAVNPEYTTDAYTVVLLHMNGANNSTTFTDETEKTWTPQADAKISTSVSKYGGASGYFDGTGDYITTPDSDDFYFGTGDFTIDFWINFHSAPSSGDVICGQSSSESYYWVVQINSSLDGFEFHQYESTQTTYKFGCKLAEALGTETWYHVAIVRMGVNLYGYINGEDKTYITTQTAYAFANVPAGLTIGGRVPYGNTTNIPAYIDEFRISKGIARFEPFGLPTEEYAIDDYTKLLLHMNGANNSTTFTDETGKSVTRNGSTIISTSQYKLGGASGYFDGTGDYLSIDDSDDFYFGTGDFTIDFWIRFPSAPSAYDVIYSQWQDGTNRMQVSISGGATGIMFWFQSSGTAICDFGAENGASFATNTWYHIALIRSGVHYYGFIDGVNKTYITTNLGSGSLSNLSAPVTIGARNTGSIDRDIPAYIDEFRISKGIARWSGVLDL